MIIGSIIIVILYFFGIAYSRLPVDYYYKPNPKSKSKKVREKKSVSMFKRILVCYELENTWNAFKGIKKNKEGGMSIHTPAYLRRFFGMSMKDGEFILVPKWKQIGISAGTLFVFFIIGIISYHFTGFFAFMPLTAWIDGNTAPAPTAANMDGLGTALASGDTINITKNLIVATNPYGCGDIIAVNDITINAGANLTMDAGADALVNGTTIINTAWWIPSSTTNFTFVGDVNLQANGILGVAGGVAYGIDANTFYMASSFTFYSPSAGGYMRVAGNLTGDDGVAGTCNWYGVTVILDGVTQAITGFYGGSTTSTLGNLNIQTSTLLTVTANCMVGWQNNVVITFNMAGNITGAVLAVSSTNANPVIITSFPSTFGTANFWLFNPANCTIPGFTVTAMGSFAVVPSIAGVQTNFTGTFNVGTGNVVGMYGFGVANCQFHFGSSIWTFGTGDTAFGQAGQNEIFTITTGSLTFPATAGNVTVYDNVTFGTSSGYTLKLYNINFTISATTIFNAPNASGVFDIQSNIVTSNGTWNHDNGLTQFTYNGTMTIAGTISLYDMEISVNTTLLPSELTVVHDVDNSGALQVGTTTTNFQHDLIVNATGVLTIPGGATSNVVFGTAAYASTLTNDGVVRFSSNVANAGYIHGFDATHLLTATGNAWDWDYGGAGSKVKVGYLNYQITDTISGGTGITLTCVTSITVGNFTVPIGDYLLGTAGQSITHTSTLATPVTTTSFYPGSASSTFPIASNVTVFQRNGQWWPAVIFFVNIILLIVVGMLCYHYLGVFVPLMPLTAWVDGNTKAAPTAEDMDGIGTDLASGDTVNITKNLVIDKSVGCGQIISCATLTINNTRIFTMDAGADGVVVGAFTVTGTWLPSATTDFTVGNVAVSSTGIFGQAVTYNVDCNGTFIITTTGRVDSPATGGAINISGNCTGTTTMTWNQGGGKVILDGVTQTISGFGNSNAVRVMGNIEFKTSTTLTITGTLNVGWAGQNVVLTFNMVGALAGSGFIKVWSSNANPVVVTSIPTTFASNDLWIIGYSNYNVPSFTTSMYKLYVSAGGNNVTAVFTGNIGITGGTGTFEISSQAGVTGFIASINSRVITNSTTGAVVMGRATATDAITFTTGGFNYTNASPGALTINASTVFGSNTSYTLIIGNLSAGNVNVFNAPNSGGVFEVKGSSFTVSTGTWNNDNGNVTFKRAGTTTFGGNATNLYDVTVNAGTTLDTTTRTITIVHDVSDSGIFKTGSATVTLQHDITVVAGGVLDVVGSATSNVVLGTASYTSNLVNNGVVRFSANTTNASYIHGFDNTHRFIATGTGWDWDYGGVNSKVNVGYIDYRITDTTGGTGITITCVTNITVSMFTVTSGDTLTGTVGQSITYTIGLITPSASYRVYSSPGTETFPLTAAHPQQRRNGAYWP